MFKLTGKVTVVDIGSVVSGEYVCLLGVKKPGRVGKFCRRFVIRAEPDGETDVCLPARECARACSCVWSYPGNPCLYMCVCESVCVFIYESAFFMCVVW